MEWRRGGEGQVQTVPQAALEAKLGRKLTLGDTFETPTGKWKVLKIGDGTYTVEKTSWGLSN